MAEAEDGRQIWGEYERAVDEKGRIMIPPSVRSALGQSFNILCQDGPSLRLTPVEDGYPDAIRLDPQGRLRLRAFYLRWAGLGRQKRVVVAVFGNTLELWEKENWTWFIKKTGQFEFDLDPEVLRRGRIKD